MHRVVRWRSRIRDDVEDAVFAGTLVGVRISEASILFFALLTSGHFCVSGSEWIFISLDGGISRLGPVDFP
jgi:hypothetical protein